jgi:hypothetical protein
MSRSDRDQTARSSPDCIGCHTTWGFTEGHDEPASLRRPPDNVVMGIACAACHDVHQTPATESLVRQQELPALVKAFPANTLGASRVCLTCHAPLPYDAAAARLPSASVTALVLGSGGIDRHGRELSLRGGHSEVQDGCLACHGADHSFHATQSACEACHEPLERDPSLQVHARALWSRLAERGAVAPLRGPVTHEKLALTRANAQEKHAAYDIALVLLDSAADVHNPGYAALLLEQASSMLSELQRGTE